jgi:uncharacterized DUF497 family protein
MNADADGTFQRLEPSRPDPTSVLVYFLYLMDFDFDPAKSAAKSQEPRHRIPRAQALWSDPDRLEVQARSLDEPRSQVIGRIGDVVWSAFITVRSDRIRIISVRRARDEEKAAYLQD